MVTTDAVKAAIVDYIADTGMLPALRDIQRRTGIKSSSNAHKLVDELRAEGFLVSAAPNQKRGIIPVALSEALADGARYMQRNITAHTGGDA